MLDISGQGLAKGVTKYLTTQTSQHDAELRVSSPYQALIERQTKGKMSLTASAAISWSKRLGFEGKERSARESILMGTLNHIWFSIANSTLSPHGRS